MVKDLGSIRSHGLRMDVISAAERAFAAGAKPPMTYIGAGAFGIVLCDVNGIAFKVFRFADTKSGVAESAFEDELEWLQTARSIPKIKKHIPDVLAAQGENILIRECVLGRPGGWSDSRRLLDLHGEIEKATLPLGWTAPEFKEDSYIIRPDGVPVLVDASMAMRVGDRLFDYIADVNAGRRGRPHWLREGDESFFLCREVSEKALDRERVDAFLSDLGQKPCRRT